MSTPLDLIRDAARGDTRAFRALVETHQDLVYAVAFRFVRNAQDAEDITQEVFVRLWRGIGSYRPEKSKLSTWLYRITTNCCVDFERSAERKAQKGWRNLDDVPLTATGISIEHELENKELHETVLRASCYLSPRQRMVFILRDMEGLSPEDVSEVLGMSRVQVKSNLFHARQKLSDLLKEVFK